MPKPRPLSSSSSDSDSDVEKSKAKKKQQSGSPKAKKAKVQTNADGNRMYELTGKKFAVVSEFRGNKMVDIREYYEKDGDLKPGKKGISLSVDQWEKLKSLTDDVDEAVKNL